MRRTPCGGGFLDAVPVDDEEDGAVAVLEKLHAELDKRCGGGRAVQAREIELSLRGDYVNCPAVTGTAHDLDLDDRRSGVSERQSVRIAAWVTETCGGSSTVPSLGCTGRSQTGSARIPAGDELPQLCCPLLLGPPDAWALPLYPHASERPSLHACRNLYTVERAIQDRRNFLPWMDTPL